MENQAQMPACDTQSQAPQKVFSSEFIYTLASTAIMYSYMLIVLFAG